MGSKDDTMISREIFFPKTGRTEIVRFTYTLSVDPEVLLEFHDGRSIEMSVAEWVAIGLEAILSATYSQEVAANYDRQSRADAARDILAAIAVLRDACLRAEKNVAQAVLNVTEGKG